jgi:hypothetical protein
MGAPVVVITTAAAGVVIATIWAIRNVRGRRRGVIGHVDGDGVGESPDCGRLGHGACRNDLHDLKHGVPANGGGVPGARCQAECGHVGAGASVDVETFHPAATTQQELSRRQVPGLRRDAAELELDALIEPVAAGVGELAPGV